MLILRGKNKPGVYCCLLRTIKIHPSSYCVYRLEVENAEDDLVQKTEVAITLMKTVLENVCLCSKLVWL